MPHFCASLKRPPVKRLVNGRAWMTPPQADMPLERRLKTPRCKSYDVATHLKTPSSEMPYPSLLAFSQTSEQCCIVIPCAMKVTRRESPKLVDYSLDFGDGNRMPRSDEAWAISIFFPPSRPPAKLFKNQGRRSDELILWSNLPGAVTDRR